MSRNYDTVNNIQSKSMEYQYYNAEQKMPINHSYSIHKCKCKTHVHRPAGRSDRPVRHREMEDPSVYAKRSFPLSTVNTRQTPRRVNAQSASQRDICRRGNPTNPAGTSSTNGTRFGKRLSTWSRSEEKRAPVDSSIPPLWSSKCSSTSHRLRPIDANGKCTKCRTHHKLSHINNYHINKYCVRNTYG